jgi:glycosyltransferase involved in cell wall biosynthesis
VNTTASEKGFGVYFDPTKITSGQRFFESLWRTLQKYSVPNGGGRPAAVLFNVSAPIWAIIRAKCSLQKIALRIDGLYFDRLTPAFLATLPRPLRWLFAYAGRFSRAHDFLAFWANLINQNYGGFARILFADQLIYQSSFAQRVHARYFRSKPYSIIVNGSTFVGAPPSVGTIRNAERAIRLITIYDDWKPAKRIPELVEFVRWVYEARAARVHLVILGYTGRTPIGLSRELKSFLESGPCIRTLPKFTSFSQAEVHDALLNSDMYATFTYRDPCPNAVIEAMAHGLPVVGFTSGGLPDIVGDAGVLLPMDDFADGFFTTHRYEREFPPIEFQQVLEAIMAVASNIELYRDRVRRRFVSDLGMDVVAERYAAVLSALARRGIWRTRVQQT